MVDKDLARVGVLGGTFDPPHIGHLVAAEEARVQLDLERVTFVPAGIPPHKLGEPVTPAVHRVEMTMRAVASNPYFFVSLVDVERAGPSHTVDTLKLLRARWGASTDIYFILGLDMLADLPNWHEPQQLVELCRLAVVDRPGYDIDMDELDRTIPGVARQVDQVSMPRLEVSSTDLRRRVRQSKTIRYYVPVEVEAYVHAHRVYA